MISFRWSVEHVDRLDLCLGRSAGASGSGIDLLPRKNILNALGSLSKKGGVEIFK